MDEYETDNSHLLQLFTAVATIIAAYFLLHRLLKLFTTAATTVHLPPSPPKLPLIGHLHLLTSMPHHSLSKLSQSLGPIIHLHLGQIQTVVISSAQLARDVLKTHDAVLCNRPQLISAQYLSFGCSDVTFSSYGPYWRQARKICVNELLSPRRVSSFQLVRADETDRMLKTVSDRAGSPVDLSHAFFVLANDVLCRVAFGRRLVSNGLEDDSKIKKVKLGEEKKKSLVEVLTETQELFSGFCVGDFFPRWGWVNSLSGYKRRLEKNLKDLRAVGDEIIRQHLVQHERRRVQEEEETDGEDFVDVLLRIQQREDLEVPITDDNLKALVLDMFVAGTDTTSSTLEWTMTELARHPEAMRKAQEEVRHIGSSSNGTIEETHLPHLHYMKAAIKEAMRLHPPAPLLVPRESMAPCELGGFDVPPNTRVLINTYAIGRDPKSWTDPLSYDPERFMGKDGAEEFDLKGGRDFKFLPFGAGRRGCPGYPFGLATVEIALARLLYHFDWELPDGVVADEMDLSEVFGLATRKKTTLVLVPKINMDPKSIAESGAVM